MSVATAPNTYDLVRDYRTAASEDSLTQAVVCALAPLGSGQLRPFEGQDLHPLSDGDAVTPRGCAILFTRAIACASAAGFHRGVKMNM